MNVTPQVWGITIAVIVGLFAFDLVVNARSPHAPTFRQSAAWSAVYLSLAVIFGLVVLWIWGGTYAGEYYAGFVTEWALSVDNLFVFTIIMSSFAVPREHQQKVLLIGILMALVMRGHLHRAGRGRDQQVQLGVLPVRHLSDLDGHRTGPRHRP